MQSKPLKFSPICGTEFKTDECFAGAFRMGSVRQWLFNPWTGTVRASQDIVGDPYGLLIHDGVEPVEAFAAETARRNKDRVVRALVGDMPVSARKALPDWAEQDKNSSAAGVRVLLCEQVAGGLRPDMAACVDTGDCIKYARCQRTAPVVDTLAAAREALHDAAEREPVHVHNPLVPPGAAMRLKTELDHNSSAAGHPLQAVFALAIEQATKGKGVRHGGEATPFLDQPWVHRGKMHGRGFLTGQAAKKLEEAASTRTGEAFITEALGALVYIGMAILKEQGKV